MLVDEKIMGKFRVAHTYQQVPRTGEQQKDGNAAVVMQFAEASPVAGEKHVQHEHRTRQHHRLQTLAEHAECRGRPGHIHPAAARADILTVGSLHRQQKRKQTGAHEKRHAHVERVEVPHNHVINAAGENRRRAPGGAPVKEPHRRPGGHEHAQEAGERNPQPRAPVVFAKQCIGRRRGPVLQNRLLEVFDAIEPRRHPVAAGEHLARDLGVAPLVGLEQVAVLQVHEPSEGEQYRHQQDFHACGQDHEVPPDRPGTPDGPYFQSGRLYTLRYHRGLYTPDSYRVFIYAGARADRSRGSAGSRTGSARGQRRAWAD